AELSGPGDSDQSGWLQFNRNAHDNFSMRRNNGNYLFDVWNSDDGPRLTLWRYTGTPTFNVGQTWFRYHNGDDLIVALGKGGGGNTYIYGGTTSNGNQTRCRIVATGRTAERLFRFQDGGGSTLIPIAC